MFKFCDFILHNKAPPPFKSEQWGCEVINDLSIYLMSPLYPSSLSMPPSKTLPFTDLSGSQGDTPCEYFRENLISVTFIAIILCYYYTLLIIIRCYFRYGSIRIAKIQNFLLLCKYFGNKIKRILQNKIIFPICPYQN